MYVIRRARFCASHRLNNPDLSSAENREIFGPCNNPHGHGHNYDLEVMNGAVGQVLDTFPNGDLVVGYPEASGFREVHYQASEDHLEQLAHAYALTIHKAQGSEWPVILVVVHKSHSFMHSNQLFYTGVTRARRSAILLGDRWGLRNCAQRQLVDLRRTFLSLLGGSV